jgi:hypothetical protein
MDNAGEKVEPEHPELASQPANLKTDIDLARLIGRVLGLAARKVGIEKAHELGVPELCERLVTAAQDGGRLDPTEYRLAYMFITRH